MTSFLYRFTPGVLAGYLGKIFLKYCLIVTGFFFFLIYLIHYLEIYRKLSGDTAANSFTHFQIAFAQTPIIILQAAALIICFAACGAALQLSANSELIAAKASGMSSRRLFFIFGNTGLALGAVLVLAGQPIATKMFQSYRLWEKNENAGVTTPVRTVFRANGKSVLVLTETPPFTAGRNAELHLGETEIYFLNENDLNETTIFSKTAKLRGRELTLIKPTYSKDQAENPKEYTLILPSADIFSEPEKRVGELLTFYDFPKEIARRENNDIPADLFRIRYYEWLTLPLLFFINAACAIVFVPKSPRRGKTALFAITCIAFGAVAYGLSALGLSLANAGAVAPLTGALFPKIALFFLLFYILMQREYGR